MNRGREPDDVGLGGCTGACWLAAPMWPLLTEPLDGVVLWRTNRCVSSASSSLSPSASNASARSGSTWPFRVGDEAREWNDGGGEFGTGLWSLD